MKFNWKKIFLLILGIFSSDGLYSVEHMAMSVLFVLMMGYVI